jgi:CheY-like chemotaxis protein
VLAAHGAPDHVHGPVDLLLVDMRLDHGDDGVAAISRLRRQWGRDVPALILTGDTAIGTRERIAASGLPMLEKPVSALRLRSALTRLLQRG